MTKDDDKKLYCIKFNQYRNWKTLKYHVFDETLVLSTICEKCGSNEEKTLKGEE